MKPTFALNLSNERVALLHRTGRGWLQVGDVAFDTPDLSEALDYLRKTALGLSPRGVSTKLVIPNSEILYCDVEAPGPDDETRRKQIRAGLAGRTPYAPEDLVFDWRGKGTMVKVAVVARQTLTEAEAFAVEHRFGPVSFVALPDPSQFKGEPFFGQTEAAKTILAKGEAVEPDRDAMTIVTRDLPLADVPTEPEERPAKRSERHERHSGDPIAGAVEKLRAAAQADASAATRTEPAKNEAGPAPAPDAASANEPTPATSSEAAAEIAPSVAVEAAAPPAARPIEDKPVPVATSMIDEAPFAEVIDTQPAGLSGPDDPFDDLPPAPSPAAQMAFASRRSSEEGLRNSPSGSRAAQDRGFGDLPGAARSDPLDKRSIPPIRSDAQVTAPSIPGSKKRKAGPSSPPPAVAAAAAALASSTATMGKSTKPLTRPGGTFGAKPLPQRGKPRYLGLILTGVLLVVLALIAAWSSYSLVQNQTATPNDATALATNAIDPSPATAPPSVTGESVLNQKDILNSSDVGSTVANAGGASEAALDATAALPADGVVTAEDEAAADGEAVSGAATVAPEPRPDAAPAPDAGLTVAGSEAAADPAAATSTDTAIALAAEATPAPNLGLASAASGPEPRAGDLPPDEVFLATADTPPAVLDALRLPDPVFPADVLPAAAPPPPPFGTVYQFDAAGLIVPTPQGILAPEGYMLFAGAPPVTPPVRSPAVTAAANAVAALPAEEPAPDADALAAAATAAASLAAPVATPPTAPADPALAGFRPRPRPDNLSVPAAAKSADDASLSPATGTEVATLRPRTRPATLAVAGSAARNETAAASLTAQANAAVEAAVASAADTGNLMTLAVSRRPAARPQDMSRAVNAAVAAAIRAPESEPEVAPSNDALPEGDNEPELARVAPKIPTRATVAKQATFANAINLSKINLIGVYGTPSKRYALIRLASGRYKKVAVGDSVDGGRVEAITATEVRYQKSGRLVSLKMPRA